MDTWTLRGTSAWHESWHVMAAEALSVRVENATVIPVGRSRGSVGLVRDDGTIRSRMIVCHAPRAALRKYDLPVDGCGGDWEQAGVFARLRTDEDGAARLMDETMAAAHDLVRNDEIEYVVNRLARELVERKRMRADDIGAAIAKGRESYRTGEYLGQKRPAYSLTGCGPLEQLHRRREQMAAMGITPSVATTPKAKAKAKRKRPAGRAQAVRRETAVWFVARESFIAVLEGGTRREQIKAGITGVARGHELVEKYPDKFEPMVSRAEANAMKVAGMMRR